MLRGSKHGSVVPNKVKFDPSGSCSSFALDNDDDEGNHFATIKNNLSVKFNESVLGLWNSPSQDSMAFEEDDDSMDQEEEKERMDYYFQEFAKLQFTEGDMQVLVADDHAFRSLQKLLKKKNCTTNLYLTQNMHYIVKYLKEKRQRKESRKSDVTAA